MEAVVVQDKIEPNYLLVGVEHPVKAKYNKILPKARLAAEDWGQKNGYGSIIPYFESLAGGNDTVTVFSVSFISFIR